MASHGIRDQVAVVGAGCTAFAEHWERGPDDLIVEAVAEALAGTDLELGDVDAFWLGTAQTAMSGIALARPLGIEGKPVVRVENMCATGSEAMRQAAYAVASGAYDTVMAVGVEKVKDSGFQGLNAFPIPHDGTARTLTAAAMFSMVVPAYAERYGVEVSEVKRAMAQIAAKNHANGVLNPRAQFRKAWSVEELLAMPKVAGELSVLDCSGVADGAAAVVLTRADDTARATGEPVYIKALASVAGTGSGLNDSTYDFTTFREIAACALDAYAQAGVGDPVKALALAEVHDCFTPTELVLMEDLGFSERGQAWKDIEAGRFDLRGELAVNPDGGLKSFGHPVGATGLRMVYEASLQLRDAAPTERSVDRRGRTMALTHNLGGFPGEMVSFISILGTDLGPAK